MPLVLNSTFERLTLSMGSSPVHIRQISSMSFSALFLQKSGLLNLHPYFVHKKPVGVFSLYMCFMVSFVYAIFYKYIIFYYNQHFRVNGPGISCLILFDREESFGLLLSEHSLISRCECRLIPKVFGTAAHGFRARPLLKMKIFSKADQRAIDKRTIILNAALKTFVKRGYPDTKVAEIASEAGVAEGTLYNYFSSKEDLLLALFDEKWGGIIAEIKSRINRLSDPNSKLKAIFSQVVMMFRKNRQLAELFMVDIKQSSIFLNNYTINRIAEFLDIIEGVLEEGKSKGIYRKDLDTRVAKMVIFGAAQGILLSWVLSESKAVKNQTFNFSLYRAAKTLKDIFKSGLVGEK